MSSIFLAYNSVLDAPLRTGLFNTLLKAGLQAYPSDLEFNGSIQQLEEKLTNSKITVHVVGLNYGEELENGLSIEENIYRSAFKKLIQDPSRHMFVWFPFTIDEVKDERQLNLIREIRNSIREGVHFSNTPSPIQLVDDLRLHVREESKSVFDIKETDIFLVYNQLDDLEASSVADMLSDIVPIEKLNIIQDNDLDYSEFCLQQIGKSKLAVVYFKESADWALPFTQQIWKKVGGASSHTPILLIGDEDPDSNHNKKFIAPKVVSLIVSGELIPLEIKVQFDKIVNAIS